VQIETLLGQGIQLMFIGMGSVFAFLSLLVLTLKLVSALSMRITPKPDSIEGPIGTNQTAISNDQEIVAVISAAISQYRSRH